MGGPVDASIIWLLAIFAVACGLGVAGLVLAVGARRRLNRLQFEVQHQQRQRALHDQAAKVPCPVCGAANGQSCTNMLFGGRVDVPPQPHTERGPV